MLSEVKFDRPYASKVEFGVPLVVKRFGYIEANELKWSKQNFDEPNLLCF